MSSPEYPQTIPLFLNHLLQQAEILIQWPPKQTWQPLEGRAILVVHQKEGWAAEFKAEFRHARSTPVRTPGFLCVLFFPSDNAEKDSASPAPKSAVSTANPESWKPTTMLIHIFGVKGGHFNIWHWRPMERAPGSSLIHQSYRLHEGKSFIPPVVTWLFLSGMEQLAKEGEKNNGVLLL